MAPLCGNIRKSRRMRISRWPSKTTGMRGTKNKGPSKCLLAIRLATATELLDRAAHEGVEPIPRKHPPALARHRRATSGFRVLFGFRVFGDIKEGCYSVSGAKRSKIANCDELRVFFPGLSCMYVCRYQSKFTLTYIHTHHVGTSILVHMCNHHVYTKFINLHYVLVGIPTAGNFIDYQNSPDA